MVWYQSSDPDFSTVIPFPCSPDLMYSTKYWLISELLFWFSTVYHLICKQVKWSIEQRLPYHFYSQAGEGGFLKQFCGLMSQV